MSKSQVPTIAITGANGFLGQALVEHFSSKGWYVRALVRDANKTPKKQNVTYYDYDLTAEPSNESLKGVDFLVHAAYIKEDRAHPKAFDTNVEGTRLLLEKSRHFKLKRNIFMSTMSAYEGAVSTYAKQKLAIEKLFDQPQDTIIRSGLIIGNGGLIKQIVSFMRSKHVAPLIDSGEQPLQVIAAYDMCRVIENICQNDIEGTLMVGTPEVYSYREFYLTVSQKQDIKVALIPVPFWIPLLAIRTINFLHLPLGVTEDNLWGLKKLRSFETLDDLKKLNVTLDPLDVILDKVTISK
jgi:NADH dehydrogenase